MIRKICLKNLILLLLLCTSFVLGGIFAISPKVQDCFVSDDFLAYSEQANALVANYINEDEFEVELSKDCDIIEINGINYLDIETFALKTGVKVGSSNGTLKLSANGFSTELKNENSGNNATLLNKTIYNTSKRANLIPLNDACENLGYEVIYNEDGATIKRPYQTKTLIIESYSQLDYQGAIGVAEGYKNIHVFQYETEYETYLALKYYESLDCVTSVFADSYFYVDEIVETNENQEIEIDGLNDTFSYMTWGYKTFAVKEYADYLNNAVTSAKQKEVIVAVLDTGIDTDHSMFVNRLVRGGKDFTGNTSSTSGFPYEDGHSHGTHVSGTIVDLTESNVKILPVKVLSDSGKGVGLSVTNGCEYVLELADSMPNIKVVNMSLGAEDVAVGSYSHIYYKERIDNLYNANIISVVAAGNEERDVSMICPANIETAITVSAIDEDWEFAYFSNYGAYVDFTAPGVSIKSANKNGGTTTKSGTSMATPHLSAIYALILSDGVKNHDIKGIETILKETAVDIGDPGFDGYFGYGIPSLEAFYMQEMENVRFNELTQDITSPFYLELGCESTYNKIMYTTDGSVPCLINGTSYSEEIYISEATTVKAVAYYNENGVYYKSKEVVSRSYDLTTTYTFSINSEGLIIGYSGNAENLAIPKRIDGITVLGIGSDVFKDNITIKTVGLPNTCITIEANAFSGCTNLATITMSNMQSIGVSAFYNCSSLTGTLPNTLISIQDQAFTGCIKLPNKVFMSKLQSLSGTAFQNSGVTEIVLSDAFNRITTSTCSLSTIYGYAGSNAQSYANSYGVNFVEIPRLQIIQNLPASKYTSANGNGSLYAEVIGLNTTIYWYKNTENSYENASLIKSGSENDLSVTLLEGEIYYYFIKVVDWEGNEVYSTICQVSIPAPLTLTATSGENGTISPIGETLVEYEGSLTYTFTANIGYEVSEILVDGIALNKNQLETAVVNGYRFNNVITNHTISVTFAKIHFNLVASSPVNGSISPAGTTSMEYGGKVKYTFTPNEGYYVSSVIVDGIELNQTDLQNAIENGYTFSNILDNHTISVEFKIFVYNITASETENGSISPAGVSEVEYGKNLTYTFTPILGYYVSAIYVDGNQLSEASLKNAIANGYTFSYITKNHTISALFLVDILTITARDGNNGTISPKGVNEVEYGESLTLTFAPNPNYEVYLIEIDGVKLNNEDLQNAVENGYTFENISQSHTIYVDFRLQIFYLTSNSGENGTISPKGKVEVEYNKNYTYEITPYAGYELDYILVDGQEVETTSENSYTFYNVKQNHEIEVAFKVADYEIAITILGNANIMKSSTLNNISYGETRTINIDIPDGYALDYVLINNEETEVSSYTITFNDIAKDFNIYVVLNQVPKTNNNTNNSSISPIVFIAVGAGVAVILIVIIVIVVVKKKKGGNGEKVVKEKKQKIKPQKEKKVKQEKVKEQTNKNSKETTSYNPSFANFNKTNSNIQSGSASLKANTITRPTTSPTPPQRPTLQNSYLNLKNKDK